MDNSKTPSYYINKIICDIKFSILHVNGLSLHDFENNEVLTSAISFKFVQISENAKKIPEEIIKLYQEIPWYKINGLRNKIVHDYGSIQLEIIYDTILCDFPVLLNMLEEIMKE